MKRNRPYDLLARYYEDLVPGVDDMSAHARQRVLGDLLEEVDTVCDLGCGPGATSRRLASAGLRVYAVDRSPTFIEQVTRAKRRWKGEVHPIEADMRTFRLPEPVDFVLCQFSVLNNLDRRADLAPTLRAVHRALKPGGWFAFDVDSTKSWREQGETVQFFETKRFKVVLKGHCEEDGERYVLEFDWFVKEGKFFWHQRETVVHVAWTDAEIRAALKEAGFTAPRVFDGVDVRPPMEGAKRGTDRYFLTRKKAVRGRARA